MNRSERRVSPAGACQKGDYECVERDAFEFRVSDQPGVKRFGEPQAKLTGISRVVRLRRISTTGPRGLQLHLPLVSDT